MQPGAGDVKSPKEEKSFGCVLVNAGSSGRTDPDTPDATGATLHGLEPTMTNQLTRRQLLSVGAAASVAALPTPRILAGAAARAEMPRRKFYAILSLGRLGFQATFPESLELTVKHGFEGLDPDPNHFASLGDDGLKRLLDDLRAKNLRFGAAGLPVEFRKDEARFSDGLKNLPATADILQRAGVWRVSTWVLPCSNDLTYPQNFRQHAGRLRQCAQILADHGQKLGLEYVAPRTLLRSQRHPFIHTMSEMKELIVAIGTNNLGIQLDSWHWFNAEETDKDLLTLRGSDVLTVDLNDAPIGLSLDEYRDDHRELPAATGVIPVKDFLGSLVQIGYDGPIQPEPFNAALRAKSLDQACASASAAMKTAF
ncbi:MAG TPA: sugar phosphate isomerase/epimerase family protein, partial [Candidatus Acidoferrales bacterium]|nr:sugar phosphate isomerase/epimerase family protein [Candidatus Acidoferrales bacterium]